MIKAHRSIVIKIVYVIFFHSLGSLLWSCGDDTETTKTVTNENQKISIIENTDHGKDTSQFESYSDMLNTAPVKTYGVRAELLIEFISTLLLDGATLEDNDVFESLMALTPYRMTPEVQTAISKWALISAQRIQSADRSPFESDIEKSLEDLKSGNKAYRSLNYDKAAAQYIHAIEKNPESLDARNNLALVCMHQGYDTVAKVQLLTILALNKDYVPGLINLTVVCERLELSAEARDAANRALKIQSMAPAVAVNAALYEYVAGRYENADDILKPISEFDIEDKKFKSMQEIIEMSKSEQ